MNVLVTGSSGLIGSEAVRLLDQKGHAVTGVDNNMRREFFGPGGDTTWVLERLKKIAEPFIIIHWIFVIAREFFSFSVKIVSI